MNDRDSTTVDMHCHVGLIGDVWPEKGGMSDEYRRSCCSMAVTSRLPYSSSLQVPMR